MSSTDRLSAALIATARQSSNASNLGSERASFFLKPLINSLKPRGGIPLAPAVRRGRPRLPAALRSLPRLIHPGLKCLFGSFRAKNDSKRPFRGRLRVNFCTIAATTPNRPPRSLISACLSRLSLDSPGFLVREPLLLRPRRCRNQGMPQTSCRSPQRRHHANLFRRRQLL